MVDQQKNTSLTPHIRAHDWIDFNLSVDEQGINYAVNPAMAVVVVPADGAEAKIFEASTNAALKTYLAVSRIARFFAWFRPKPKKIDEPKLFHRNALQKNTRTGETIHKRVLVAKLDGVYAYISGNNVIITKQDLNL